MKSIAGIFRRLLALGIFIGFSSVVCCGVNKHLAIQSACASENVKSAEQSSPDFMQPNQLVSFRVLEII
jgi:hypothetical protein